MTRRPGSAVHVPPDCFENVSASDLNMAAALCDDFGGMAGINQAGWMAAYTSVAAMLRRLAPYLPEEAAQEAVQGDQGKGGTQ